MNTVGAIEVFSNPATVGDITSRGSRRRIVIVAPHFPPSNLASVHRARLFANHLPEFGWEPVIVTVHEDHYEEALDWNLAKLLPKWLRIERVAALPTRPFRIIGDIAIRGFFPLLWRILDISRRERVDFLYIPIPSYYAALLGRIVKALRGIPYGIDYIDPWVHAWPGAERVLSKAWLSSHLSRILEPIATRKASVITGVAAGYYEGVLMRNRRLRDRVRTAAMPYGGEAEDHAIARALSLPTPLIGRDLTKFNLVYAGAMLPRAIGPLERLLRSIARHRERFEGVKFTFIGTGKRPDDAEAYNVRPLAERFGLWPHVVEEHPKRLPYLEVLAHLDASDGVFILGSTEPHYTPSKVYQAVLSGKPVFAVLHEKSSACTVIRESAAGIVLPFAGEDDLDTLEDGFPAAFDHFIRFSREFDASQVDQTAFRAYTARTVAAQLARVLEEAVDAESGTEFSAR